MFSGLNYASLFELYERVRELVEAGENRSVLYEIAAELEFLVERDASYPKIVGYQGIEPDTSFKSLYLCEEVTEALVWFIVRGQSEIFLTSPTGTILRGSQLFLEKAEFNSDQSVHDEFHRHNNDVRWLFFDHPHLLLSLECWDRFAKEFLIENGMVSAEYVLPIAEMVRPFVGWSVCFHRSALPGNIGECLELSRLGVQLEPTEARPGRKRMKEARRVWMQMGFDRGALSWSQLQDRIERQTGERPSPRALRDWAEEGLADTTGKENGVK